ncbi:hypothetical protein HK104_009471 [Borealophlyctis nickersoniae]|nr:hypothetical protein HK104_009471 [Borealophlyctis nickersoniae]
MRFTIAILASLALAATSNASPFSRRQTAPNPEYDFIVVGSGPGGGVLASRLALAGYQTLLIDAGPDYSSLNTTIPVFNAKASEDPQIEWDYYVRQGDASQGQRQSVWYPRSGGLGGCAEHNSMIHMYPFPDKLDEIATLFNDPTWNDNSMRQYFQRIENASYPEPGNGQNGWLQTTVVSLFNYLGGNLWDDKLYQYHVIPSTIDINKGYKRSSVYDLIKMTKQDPQAGPRLTIWTDTLVTSLEFAGDTTTVTGVNYIQGRHLYSASPLSRRRKSLPPIRTVRARREVILSAGTFNTPQLLMLSGIGDPAHLSQFNIPTRVNLPGVGRNLQDKIEVAVNIQMNDTWVLTNNCTFTATSEDPCYTYYKDTPQFSAYGVSGALIGLLKKSDPKVPTSDVHIAAGPLDFRGYEKGWSDRAAKTKNVWTALIQKARPSSKSGRVTLRSTSPLDTPKIDINYFSSDTNGADMAAVVQAIKYAREVYATGVNTIDWVDRELSPGAHIKTDAELAAWVRGHQFGHHACCTAAMGLKSGPNAVVGGDFKVWGVQRLRVVDHSVWRENPGFFPTTPLYMMSEKAADVIIAAAKAQSA